MSNLDQERSYLQSGAHRARRRELSPQRWQELSARIQTPSLTLPRRAALRLRLFLEEETIVRRPGELIPCWRTLISFPDLYAPGEKEIQYFLARFVSLMWEIDRYKSKENLIQAAGMTIDEGAGKLNGWINENNIFGRLKENDSLTRTVAINSVTQLDKGAAIVRISTVERGLNVPEKRAKWLITLHFKLIPPETAADILKNPLGIYIHNMTIQEDLG